MPGDPLAQVLGRRPFAFLALTLTLATIVLTSA